VKGVSIEHSSGGADYDIVRSACNFVQKKPVIVVVAVYQCPGLERAARFSQKVVAGSSYIPFGRLPQTSDAAQCHSLHVHHQLQAWLGNNVDATKWG